MDALRPDRAVGMPAARREVIRADDRRTTVDPTAATHMVRRCERVDRSVGAVRGEPGDAADLPEAAIVEQQGDALSAVQLPPAALTNDARFRGTGRQPFRGKRLERADIAEHGRPGVLGRWCARGRAHRCLTRGEHDQNLAERNRITEVQLLHRRHDAGARCRHEGLHLHRVEHEERVTGVDDIARSDSNLEHGAGHRAGDRLLTVPNRQHRRASDPQGPRAGDDSRLVEQAAGGRGLFRGDGSRDRCGLIGEEGGPRVAGAHGRQRQDGPELREVRRNPGDVEVAERADRPLHRGFICGRRI